jgi:DNA recombination protein RmuC
MTVALAIAVVLLAAGLIYALAAARQRSEPEPEIDLGATIQEATSRAVAAAIPGFLRANEEARKVDVQAAEAALGKREAEFRRLTEPIGQNLERIEKEVVTLTRDRRTADGAVKTLLAEMKAGLGDLGDQTGTLVKALRQPQTRGRWGEVQLKRCVEIAGMTEHVDFELQQTLNDGEALQGPPGCLPGGA